MANMGLNRVRFVVVSCLGLAWAGHPAEGWLERTRFAQVAQSTDASPAQGASQALDGSGTTSSLTANVPGSHWYAALSRPYVIKRLELINGRTAEGGAMGGLTVRLLDIEDQVVGEQVLPNPGAGGTNVLTWPDGLRFRTLWLGLSDGRTNDAGTHQVGLAEARLFGELDIPHGPPPWTSVTNPARVYQSSTYSSSFPAVNAIDGNPATFTHTEDEPDGYWMVDLGRATPLDRVELVNRIDCCSSRLGGLVLRLFDGASNSIASSTISNPGRGAV
ncbi:MAG: galactose-binding domain-containing protein, partial [Limisphaerales bacterium]